MPTQDKPRINEQHGREAAIANRIVAGRKITRKQLVGHIMRTMDDINRDILSPAGAAITMLNSDNPEHWEKAFEYLNRANALHTFGKCPFLPVFVDGVDSLDG